MTPPDPHPPRVAMAARSSDRFTPEERAAMKERARELKAEAKAERTRAEGERDVRAALDAMPAADRELAEHVHAVVSVAAPALLPRTWYGMPAYARDGKVVCFFQGADKFDARYATLGFTDAAMLDDGVLWPTAFGLSQWTDEVEATVADLVARATR